MDINTFAEKIIADKKFRNEALRRYEDNCYILDEVSGNITASALKSTIYAAKCNRKICSILPGILWHSNKDSVSDENFLLLLSFPQKVREKLLFPISHHSLAFSQLQIINSITGEYEAFAQLFDIICKNDCFNHVDMAHLLRENKGGYVTEAGILACIEIAQKRYGESDKIKEAKKWVDSNEVRR